MQKPRDNRMRCLGYPWRTNFLFLCSLVVLLGYKTPFPRHPSINRLIDRELHSFASLHDKNRHCQRCTCLFSSSQVDVAVPLKQEIDTETHSHKGLHLPIHTVHTLLIDNFDSYTYNIWQLLAEVNGMNPTVVYNNAFDGNWDALMSAYPDIDNIVLSPGPGSPDVAHDFGLCLDAIKRADIPVLGVCLGHQGIAHAFGGQVIRAPTPMHGRLSAISHDGDGLFSGIPQQTDVVRYHSLIASDPLPDDLRATAWTTDGIIMGLQHLTKPLYGVQFHPESVATACGRQLFSNFKSITLQQPPRDKTSMKLHHHQLVGKELPYQQQPSQQHNVFPKPISPIPIHRTIKDVSQNGTLPQSSSSPRSQPLSTHDDKTTTISPSSSTITRERHVFIHRKHFNHDVDVHSVFKQLHGISPASFWLDSSNAPTSLPTKEIRHGRLSAALSFFGEVTKKASNEHEKSSAVKEQAPTHEDTDSYGLTNDDSFAVEYYGSNKLIVRTGQKAIQLEQNIFNYLDDRLKQSKMYEQELIHLEFDSVDSLRMPLPFNVTSALFGYLGYEARHEAASILTHPPLHDDHIDGDVYNMSATLNDDYVPSRWERNLSYPMALFLSPNEYAVYDHENRDMYVVSTTCVSVDDIQEIERAMQRANFAGRTYLNRIIDAASTDTNYSPSSTSASSSTSSSHLPIMSLTTNTNTNTTLHALRCRQQYRDDIHKCLDYIKAGESYEICLTLQFQGILEAKKDESLTTQHLDVYTTLRSRNPAPYSCYLHYDPIQLMKDGIDNSEGQPVIASTLPLTSTSQIIVNPHHDHTDERINNGNGELLTWYRPGGFSVCSSSPERYLKATKDGLLESKPIKGTARRDVLHPDIDEAIARDLESDEKSRAENLMIVDLVRNDLGRVCDVGSVHVPVLMNVESYASVHQLVSTVRGTLQPHRSLADVLVATFPGGSMTGAPKLRTMDLIDEMEGAPRGIYSGAMGFIGLNGEADLNIVIRTAVLAGTKSKNQIHEDTTDRAIDGILVTIGSGGAIVAMSDPDKEVAEVVLKAQTVCRSLGYQISFGDDDNDDCEQ